MRIFRCDRINNVNSYIVRNTGGGVCIFVDKRFSDHANLRKFATVVTRDYEIVTVLLDKPCFRKMALLCVYKPPKGNVKNLIAFLKTVVSHEDIKGREIWILGDFNIDWLQRDGTVQLISFCKNAGIRQYMQEVTCPNKKGGSCIDLIMSNSNYIDIFGVMNDIISDHYTVYCVRKKARELKEMHYVTVRDYSKYDEDLFVQLIRNLDWSNFDTSLDPNDQWLFIRTEITTILKVI